MAVITPARAGDSRLGSIGLSALDALISDLHHVFEFEVLDASLLGCEVRRVSRAFA
jgi:hypothetical protein